MRTPGAYFCSIRHPVGCLELSGNTVERTAALVVAIFLTLSFFIVWQHNVVGMDTDPSHLLGGGAEGGGVAR